MKTITRHTVRTVVMTTLCAFGPALAIAQQQSVSADVSRSTKVSMVGLDLSTMEGMSSARDRLHGSAVRLCTQVIDDLDLSHHANFLKCVDSTVTGALQQITGAGAVAATKQPSATKSVIPPTAAVARAKTVSLSDLDLSTPDGAHAAHERLHEAARTLCAQVADELDLSVHDNYLACMDDAMARSLPAIQQLAHKNAPVRGLASNLSK